MLERFGYRCRDASPCTPRCAPIERNQIPRGAEAAMTPEAENVTLEDLRRRLTDIDRQLIALVAERKAVSEEVARVKRATGKPTRDYGREREVILGQRRRHAALGGRLACAEDHLALAPVVARRLTRGALDARHFLAHRLALGDERDQLAVDVGQAPAQVLQRHVLGFGRHGGLGSSRNLIPFYRGAAGGARACVPAPIPKTL